jgi:hypothetical protein
VCNRFYERILSSPSFLVIDGRELGMFLTRKVLLRLYSGKISNKIATVSMVSERKLSL